MNSAMPEPTAMHRAALSLHALSDADCAWVLQALPVGQQQALRALLDELQALGIAKDSRVFDEILKRPESDATPKPAFSESDAEAIVRLLAGEPPRVAAALTARGDLPWLTPLAAPALGAGDSVVAPLGPSLQAAVRAEMTRLLAVRQPEPAPASFWGRVRSALQLRERAL